MPLPENVEQSFIELLSLVYGSVAWSKMNTSKNAWDIWNHRLRHAATRPTLDAMTSRLCNTLGLQSLPEAAIPLLDSLRPHETDLLLLAYRDHVPVAMRAALLARQSRQAKRPKTISEEGK